MARYTIDFSTNASRIAKEIGNVNEALAKTVKQGKQNKITLELDTTKLRTSIDATFRQLDNQIAAMQRKLSNLQIGSRRFQQQATGLGVVQGMRERGGMQARAIQLGAQAEAFDIGSATRLTKQLEAARIEAGQIAPNTEAWVNLQQQIGRLKADLQAADRLAENVQMRENLGAFAHGSLNALEAKLTILRNRAREIAPSTAEWKRVNREIVKTEQSIEKQTRRPLTKGQRMGAAGGAFLYGGGLGGGAGSAIGGIAGGLMGGVPGAFTGAAIGQFADNIGGMAAGVAKSAASIAQLQRGLALASIDAQDFADAQRAIKESSDTLVVPIEQVYRQFTQLRVNTKQYNLSVKDTQEILEGVVLAVSSTGGSLDDVNGAMRAVVQIFSKGSVQAEELRGQLGERFPGAVVKFAQANKMSFEELQDNLQQGKVTVGDFVTFAKKNYEDYAKFSERLATGPEFAGRRLEKAMNDIQIAIGSALGPAGAVFQDFFTESIQGFADWVNENKEFIGQYLKDWAKLATDFARIVGGIAKIAINVSTTIVKFFSSAFREIRRLLGMIGVAEIKAELDRVNAQIEASGGEAALKSRQRGARMHPLLLKQSQLQQQFRAAGGQAALDAATAPAGGDFTFGGPGAGMDLDATGGKGKKEKKEKELKDFAKDEAARLRDQLTLGKTLIDLQTDLTASQKGLAKADLEYSIGLDIIEAQYQAAIKTLGEYKESQRGAAQASMQNAAVLARENVTAEYRKALLGGLIGRSENYETKIEELRDSIAALTAGQENLSEAEKLEAAIKRETNGLTQEQLKIIAPYIAKTREQAAAVQALAEQEKQLKENLEKTQNLQKAQTELGVIGGGLRAGFTGEAANVFEQAMAQYGDANYATQLANIETSAMQLRSVFEGLQGAIAGVSGAFANMLTEGVTNMITGTATAKEVFANFLQSVGQALSQAASQMIATYVAIGIAKMFAGLSGGGADYSGGKVDTNAFSGGGIPGLSNTASIGIPTITNANGNVLKGGFQAFANGGVVKGPTLGLVGEGKYNEAIVPLPDGRSIPVQLGGASSRELLSGGNKQQNVTPMLSMSFQTTKFGDREYVDIDQLQAAMAETRKIAARDGANRGASLALDRLQNSPSARRKVGMR